MLSPGDSKEALTKLFKRSQVADLDTLFDTLKTTSRMSVFRRLSLLGYLTSYSHNGRYYTLSDVPAFDADGLWRFQGICFSRHGSLRATVENLVHVSEAGRTHPELTLLLQVRVHNTLLDLVRAGRIGRELLGSLYVYVSADGQVCATQLVRRRACIEVGSTVPSPRIRSSLVVEVLLEVVQGAQRIPDPATVRDRLEARAVNVTLEQVDGVYQTYGLKKTASSRSPRSQR